MISSSLPGSPKKSRTSTTTARAAVIVFIFTAADMIPYRGRLSLRVARVALALAGLLAYEITAAVRMDGVTGMLAAYALLSLFLLPERRPHAPWYEAVVLVADLAYFGVWIRVAPNSWMSAASLSYLLTSVVLLHEFV